MQITEFGSGRDSASYPEFPLDRQSDNCFRVEGVELFGHSQHASSFAGTLMVIAGLLSLTAGAELRESLLNQSIVTVNTYKGRNLDRRGSGFVVQSDQYNGYVVTNARFLEGVDTITVSVPRSGAELVAKVMHDEPAWDFALLKVNGLSLPPLTFSREEPATGDVVWSAVKWGDDDTSVGLSKGILRNSYRVAGTGAGVLNHSALLGQDGVGSVLLNECGNVIGLNMTTPGNDAGARAVSVDSLAGVLAARNIRMTYAGSECLSEVELARDQAEKAAGQARLARDNAARAQRLAESLEKKLAVSNQRNQTLLEQTRAAREKADIALAEAEKATRNAERNRLELERKTASLKAEAEAMMASFESSRIDAEKKFERALRTEKERAVFRERVLLAVSVILVIAVFLTIFVMRRRQGEGLSREVSVSAEPDRHGVSRTELHDEKLTEFVLDGRDEDGIRYLLRISGDQLQSESGVIIGRNPKDSPYIINHADVSRKHARLRMMKNRVFIEDLGSTNGTSVNGQSIEDKGPVSVDSGDQIIIGSVVMNLRVLQA